MNYSLKSVTIFPFATQAYNSILIINVIVECKLTIRRIV